MTKQVLGLGAVSTSELIAASCESRSWRRPLNTPGLSQSVYLWVKNIVKKLEKCKSLAPFLYGKLQKTAYIKIVRISVGLHITVFSLNTF